MHRRSKSLVCLALLLCLSFWLGAALAAEGEAFRAPDWDPVLGAPHGPSEWEKAHEQEFDFIYPQTDDPPTAPIVQVAEWERMSKVLIRWPLGLSTALIAEMSEDCIVVTIVANTATMNTAINSYQSAGVNMNNCEWLIAPSNSIWTRDYGPWWIFDGNDEQGIVDHIYNRPSRPDDNNIPWVYGAAYNIPVYGMPVVHTGGNYMCDGMGIGMSSNLVYNENTGMGSAAVDQYMFDFCGIENYDVVPDILTGGIHHIDCWAKMLTPNKIIAKRLNPTNSTLEANVEHWENMISSYGTPYEVVRVDCYSSTPYTNALILDDKVLVPLFGSDLDDDAMQTYADAMPGYEILGFTGSWVSDDAIHCRAKGVADQFMLRLVHVPLQDRENNGQPYEVEADIHAYSNMPMVPGTPEINWRLEGQTTWNTVSMGDQGDDIYVGYIPEQANLSTIEYYIHAEDESGRREDHPFIGAPDPHSFHIGPDVIAPEIVHQPLGNLSTYEWPATITCIATDNGAISSVTVEWFLNGSQQTDVPLTNVGGNIYSGQLTGTVSIGDNYEYRIVAVDNSTAANTTYAPESGYYGGDIVTGYLADMEDGAPGWTHSAVSVGFDDQWHLSTQQNHTQGGVQSWKCGDTGFGDYGNLLDAGLVTTEYTIETGSRLSFWQRLAAETSSSYPGYAYDGGLVEISVAGGAWEQITPVGGYPYLVRTGGTPGPFAPETPFFSGFTNGWEAVDFDLSGYSGSVQFRFRFGSDGSAGAEGWFIDDVLVVSGGAAPPNMTIDLTYVSGSPVPAGGGNIYFDVFAENAGSVPLDYDAWLETAYEGGVPTTVVMRTFSNYQPGWQINRPNMYFPVPGAYAAGNYTFAGKVGVNPNVWWDESSFPFVKEGTVGIANFQPFVPDGVPDVFGEITKPDMIETTPAEFALHGAYPNPFNPVTAISYSLLAVGHVNLSVYDVSGRKVATLVDGCRDAGVHEVTFDASGLASGVYLYRLEASGFPKGQAGTAIGTGTPTTAVGKMVLMK